MSKRPIPIPQTIREAIDSYPGGLCFSMPDGRPILVNCRMNELTAQLTGHTILDAESVWNELMHLLPSDGCARLQTPWSAQPGGAEDPLSFAFPDGRIWRFRRETLTGGEQTYVQLEASEITALYRLSEALYENNVKLKQLHARQKDLLANIVQINREKELLAVKMRVHDELGQCLIATKRALQGRTLPADTGALAKVWGDAVRDLTNIPLEEPARTLSPEAELLQVADMVGCRIDFIGERPAERETRLLLYAAVREALTNAVRHAHADRLTVSIRRTDWSYHVEISDNGGAPAAAVKEGGGLSALRQRLEQEGATMRISCADGVVLMIELPLSEKEQRKNGGVGYDEHFAG